MEQQANINPSSPQTEPMHVYDGCIGNQVKGMVTTVKVQQVERPEERRWNSRPTSIHLHLKLNQSVEQITSP